MKDTYIRVRMSEKDKETLKRLSELNQMSMSEYIINLIRIESNKKKRG